MKKSEPDDLREILLPPQENQGRRQTIRRFLLITIILILILAYPLIRSRASMFVNGTAVSGLSIQPTRTQDTGTAVADDLTQPPPTRETPQKSTATILPTPSDLPENPTKPSPDTRTETQSEESDKGIWVIALGEGIDTHLFAFHPQSYPLTRLTVGAVDDITPAISPDGNTVVFASNRSGSWDLHLLDLKTGDIAQLTDSLEYDAAPSWSPDGLWLTYESYVAQNLEILVRPVSGDQPAIPLTEHPAADFAPMWSPQGRQIAFVSTRSGDQEIWLANLDNAGEDRFQNISQNPESDDSHPTWSPDGKKLAWGSIKDGIRSLYVWDVNSTPGDARYIGSGDWPVWSPMGDSLLSRVITPDQTYLTAYEVSSPGLIDIAALAMPGPMYGLSWGTANLPPSLPEKMSLAASFTPPPAWLPALTPATGIPGDRQQVISLEDVEAPYPLLHDLVDESFQLFRTRLATEIGWDLLATLENAFVPLTAPLLPGMGDDWLYTGRAFAINTVPLNAGWMVVVREDFGLETFWRVYVRTRFQDGTQGVPLHDIPWNFEARKSGDVRAYEQGGAPVDSIPSGYWIDFTQYAETFGWERLPALGNWRRYYQGSRFNEFVHRGGLDWRTAMLELYPPEALITPTAIIPPTRTPTITPRWYRSPTPTETPTPRPSITPSPTMTNTPSPTSTIIGLDNPP